MPFRTPWLTIVGIVCSIAIGATVTASRAQHDMKGHGGMSGMDKHEEHEGNPPGWTFTLPAGGDAAKGRAVFTKLECFSCHEVRGEKFAKPAPGGAIGPELSSMAGHHTSEFIAESILNPSAVIDKGEGYEAPDGSSKMPSFNDSITVQELVDLVAFIQSLKPAAGAPMSHGSGGRHH